MRRRTLFVPDARQNVLWARQSFRDGLALSVPIERALPVRDACIIAILAEMAPRRRAILGLRISWNLIRSGTEWIGLR